MGAKTWMLVYSDVPTKVALNTRLKLDREKSKAIAAKLFANETLQPIEDVSLEFTSPPDNELYIGCYENITIVAAKEFAIDYPSRLPTEFLKVCNSPYLYLHAMHSVVDWFAYALWENSKLVRSLSLSPDSGILENIGAELPFEKPFWAGEHPLFEPGEEEEYPLEFNPLDLGETALASLFGYVLEGFSNPKYINPAEVKLLGFKRVKKSWWKVW